MPYNLTDNKSFYDEFIRNPDKNLSRIKDILFKLGNPEKDLGNTIHIAGTNGKGSTLAFLQSCLIQNNYSVNAFISPHLRSLNERIVVNNKVIDDLLLNKIIVHCLESTNKKRLSFFEFITACALKIFSENLSDWNLIEVGMGGSYDATNTLAKKDLCVITPISFDHQIFLGNSLVEIAKEKLGIINEGSPAVFGPQDSSLREVIIDYLLLRRSKGLFYGEDWDIQKKGTELIVYEDKYDKLEINSIGLNGDHQIINAGICIASLKFLQREGKIQIDDEKIRRGIKVVSWPGRLSKLSGKTNDLLMDSCEIWVDGCHNPAGSKVISKAISDMNISNKKETILILGLSEHKNINKFIMNFRDISREIIVVPLRGRKSINFIEIKNPAEAMDYSIARKSNINDALKTLKKRENIRVLICGSFSLVSEALLGD